MTSGRDLDSQAKRAAEKLAKIRDRQAKRDLRKNDETYRALGVAAAALRRITHDEFRGGLEPDDVEAIVCAGTRIEDRMAAMQKAKAAP